MHLEFKGVIKSWEQFTVDLFHAAVRRLPVNMRISILQSNHRVEMSDTASARHFNAAEEGREGCQKPKMCCLQVAMC